MAGQRVMVGSPRWMAEEGVVIDHLENGSVAGQIHLAVEGGWAASLVVEDPVKEGAIEAVAQLQALEVEVVMLTGDSRATADEVGRALQIDTIHAELLPADKIEQVRLLQQRGERVLMVGDGINDAPALAQADVGIAIGSGTDIAIESADVVLMHGALQGVVDMVRLSRATLRNIRQNLLGAFFYNSIGIPLAAGLFYPFFGILLSPIVAATAMSLSSVTVVSNALRLRRLEI